MMSRSFGRVALALALSLGLAPLLTSCGNGSTFGFAYVLSSPSSTSSSIWVYKINNETGRLTAARTPSVPNTNYINPVYAVVSPNNQYLYVLYGPTINANTGLPNPNGQDAIVVYGITHDDGNITPLETYNTGGTEPVSLAIDPNGNFLYAVDFYQNAYNNASPGPGDLTIFSISSTDGSLSAPGCLNGLTTSTGNGDICSYPVGYSPRQVTQLANNSYVYVTNSGASVQSCSSTISGFQMTYSGSTFLGLTPITFAAPAAPACQNPVPTGSLVVSANPNQPWAITSDSSSSYVYVTDAKQNLIYSATVNAAATGSDPVAGDLTLTGTNSVGNSPWNTIVDPTSAFVYVANAGSNNLSAFAITSGTGVLSTITGSPFSTGTTPLCMSSITPYLYTVNQVNGSVSGFEISSSSGSAPGSLSVLDNQPFQVSTSVSSSPNCIAIASIP
jgi:6-phosphogluconolactonase (cycloisomerase 2 family)